MNNNPLPAKVRASRIVHTASNNRVSWVGLQVVITMTDGTTRRCDHTSGHRGRPAAVACATKLVAKLNREAGTSTREVEARKAARSGNSIG